MDIINDDKNLDDIEHHIKGLELKNFQLINENNRLKMSINYLIENMKHFIDNNNQIFPELVQFCEEAKLLIVDDDEAKSESEDTRRENQYKDYQGRENEFSSISLDPYYNSNNIAANTNSLQPKSDVNEFDLQKLSDLRYDKSTFCRKESCMGILVILIN